MTRFCRNSCNANIVDPNQMPCSVAPDLGLHCLPMSLLWDAKYKWVNDSQVADSFLFTINP